MLVRFRSIEDARFFSRLAALNDAFGAKLARAICNRLALLSAAEHLGLLPTDSPFRFRSMSGDLPDHFCMDLAAGRVLTFAPTNKQRPHLSKPNGLRKITEVEIHNVT